MNVWYPRRNKGYSIRHVVNKVFKKMKMKTCARYRTSTYALIAIANVATLNAFAVTGCNVVHNCRTACETLH